MTQADTESPNPPAGDEAAPKVPDAPSLKAQKWRSFFLTIAAPIAAFVFALIVVIIVVVASGRGIDEVFTNIEETMGLGRNVIDTINKAGMYFISALAVAVGFKMNLFNIGVEGQYRLAALMAAYVGAAFNNLPGPLHILVMMFTAMLTGAIWAGIAGILKVTRGVSEVISTIMLNAIAAAMIGFLLRDGGFSPDPAGRKPSTAPIDESGWFPNLNGIVNPILDALGFKEPPKSSNTYGFILIAILLGIGYAFMLKRTRFGFDLRASGQNPEAAQASGVNAKRMVVYAMLISGSLAGLAGLPELLGGRQHTFDETFIFGVGWAGISVALLGRNSPLGMFIASFIWALLDVATRGFQRIDISNKLSAIMQAVVLLAVVIAYTVVQRRTQAAEARSVAASTPAHPVQAEAEAMKRAAAAERFLGRDSAPGHDPASRGDLPPGEDPPDPPPGSGEPGGKRPNGGEEQS